MDAASTSPNGANGSPAGLNPSIDASRPREELDFLAKLEEFREELLNELKILLQRDSEKQDVRSAVMETALRELADGALKKDEVLQDVHALLLREAQIREEWATKVDANLRQVVDEESRKSVGEYADKLVRVNLARIREDVEELKKTSPLKDHALKALITTNDRLNAQTESEWKHARLAFAVLTIFLGVLVFSGFAREWWAATKIDDKMALLDAKIAQLDTKLGELNVLQANVKRHLEFGVDAVISASRVNSIIALGQQRLQPKYEPQQAAYYARRAETELNKLLASAPEQAVGKPLESLRFPITYLAAESAWEVPNALEVERWAKILKSFDSDSVEANHFMGVSKIYQATNELVDTTKRDELRSQAIEELSQAVQKVGSGTVDQIFLAAALFDKEKYEEAALTAQKFILEYPEDHGRRKHLPKEIQAYLVIAEAWRDAAKYKSGQSETLHFAPADCELGGLRRSDGQVFRRLFARYGEIADGDEKTFSLAAIDFIDGASGCGGSAPPAEGALPAPAAPEAPEASEERVLPFDFAPAPAPDDGIFEEPAETSDSQAAPIPPAPVADPDA